MSANLDKSLDDILSTKKSAGRRRVRGGVRKSQKKATSAKAAAKPKTASSKAIAAAVQSSLNPLAEMTNLAEKVIISNLPTDVTEQSVKEYFSHEIGPITRCQASYNAKGQSTGVVSITFKRPGDAAKAANKFNGMSIDDGARTMKVELIMDPTKKPLSARIKPSAPTKAEKKAAAATKADKPKPVAPKPKAKKSKRKGRPKKSVEELDAEMADYFGGDENK